jgi:Ankyrin repeat
MYAWVGLVSSSIYPRLCGEHSLTIQCLQDGNTPLIVASSGHAEVVQLLLAAPGMDVNAANKVTARVPTIEGWSYYQG